MKERRRRPGYDTVALPKPGAEKPSLEALAFAGLPDPAAVLDGEGRLLVANAAAREEGAPAPEGTGAPLGQLLPFWNAPEGRDALLEAAVGPGGARDHEVRVVLEEGRLTGWPHFPQLKLPTEQQPGNSLPEQA